MNHTVNLKNGDVDRITIQHLERETRILIHQGEEEPLIQARIEPAELESLRAALRRPRTGVLLAAFSIRIEPSTGTPQDSETYGRAIDAWEELNVERLVAGIVLQLLDTRTALDGFRVELEDYER